MMAERGCKAERGRGRDGDGKDGLWKGGEGEEGLPELVEVENKGEVLKSPWESIAEDVQEDLLSSFQNLRNVMECQEVNLKPTLVARFGKILFHGPSVSLETVKGTSVTETTLRLLNRSFYTNVPPTYMKYTTNEVVPKIGLNFEEEKELYQVKDDEKCNIRSLINSAVLDPDVKGGLRWPLGKESSGDRYTVVGIWHTNAKTFRSSSMRLKVRHADRFDFRTSAGEVTEEVSLKMTGIASQLREQSSQIDMVTEMLKDNIKLIWDCFLCFDLSCFSKCKVIINNDFETEVDGDDSLLHNAKHLNLSGQYFCVHLNHIDS
ncbi:hypothetical protein TEA_003619 [Camellia sinensis var. sinensis]|uniref:DUF7903 domain-containing protein n=1 Tax=Camellia sinensis var. sinensis TaxID=542762 RepID=A0A4V3WMW7_CAMSN|nr:hypothetical protein TEA_003619 [Camellia sinensis var. sinensis]